MEKNNQDRSRTVNCPTGFNGVNIKAELRAVWESNVKAWKIDFAYPLSFIRQLISPVVFMIPYILYGLVLIGAHTARTWHNLLEQEILLHSFSQVIL